MLTKSDLSEIKKIVQSETRVIVQEETRKIVQEETRKIVQEETRKIVLSETPKIVRLEIDKALKPIRKDMNKISRDLSAVINVFDREYLQLRARVDRVEEHLRLPRLFHN